MKRFLPIFEKIGLHISNYAKTSGSIIARSFAFLGAWIAWCAVQKLNNQVRALRVRTSYNATGKG